MKRLYASLAGLSIIALFSGALLLVGIDVDQVAEFAGIVLSQTSMLAFRDTEE